MGKRLNDYAILLWAVAIVFSMAITFSNYDIEEKGISMTGERFLIDTNRIEKENRLKGDLPDAFYKVDVNTATEAELTAIPGVGPAIARRIVEQREKSGRFERLEDLVAVKGLGAATVAAMEEFAYCN